MLKAKAEEVKNGTSYTIMYYYKPHENYHNFIQFNSVGEDVMGTPKHHVKLPEGTHDVLPSKGAKKMIKFLDMVS